MSLEFAIQYSCPLRARYSEEHLRQWGRLSNLHTRLTTGDTSAPSEDKLKWVEEARDKIELMQAETTICANCPACLPLEAAGPVEGSRVDVELLQVAPARLATDLDGPRCGCGAADCWRTRSVPSHSR